MKVHLSVDSGMHRIGFEWDKPELLMEALKYPELDVKGIFTHFAQTEGYPPIVEVLHRVVVNGESNADLKDLTQFVVKTLPKGTYWYGTSLEGATQPGVTASCAWQHGN